MKIAHIVCSYPPYYSGMGGVVFQTVQELISRGHEVEVFTPQYDEPGEEDIDHVQRLAPSVSYGNAAHMPQLSALLNDFDVVHLHYPFFGTANLVRKWKKKNPHKPLVMTYHMDNRATGLLGLYFDFYRRFWLPRILQVADTCIASSFDYLQASDARPLFNAQKEKWVELPFGVDIERFTQREKPVPFFEELELDPNIPTLLFVGGMDRAHAFKDIPTLLDALLLLKKRDQYVQLVCVGDGELREGLALRAQAYGLSDRVRFVGSVSDELLPQYYNMADMFVLPSMHQGEAFGMVLLEAYASGIPVIATDLPGVRSVAQKAGVVVPTKDPQALSEAIEGYFSSQTDREEWKQKARHVAEENYAWAAIVDRLEDLYQSLV